MSNPDRPKPNCHPRLHGNAAPPWDVPWTPTWRESALAAPLAPAAAPAAPDLRGCGRRPRQGPGWRPPPVPAGRHRGAAVACLKETMGKMINCGGWRFNGSWSFSGKIGQLETQIKTTHYKGTRAPCFSCARWSWVFCRYLWLFMAWTFLTDSLSLNPVWLQKSATFQTQAIGCRSLSRSLSLSLSPSPSRRL